LLEECDAGRASAVLRTVLAHGLPCALTGSLALVTHLRELGLLSAPQRLHDIDLVVPGFDAIPHSLATAFVLNHVHPHAAEGKTLLQLIHPVHAVRVDLFRAFGDTLARAVPTSATPDDLHVVSIEDLRARTIANLRTQLGRGLPVDVKHARAFTALAGLGDPARLATAWLDHRENLAGTFDQAVADVLELMQAHPELLIVEEYSRTITACDRCQAHGPFSPAAPERIVEILGYW
jgi:hypothetical protein